MIFPIGIWLLTAVSYIFCYMLYMRSYHLMVGPLLMLNGCWVALCCPPLPPLLLLPPLCLSPSQINSTCMCLCMYNMECVGFSVYTVCIVCMCRCQKCVIFNFYYYLICIMLYYLVPIYYYYICYYYCYYWFLNGYVIIYLFVY